MNSIPTTPDTNESILEESKPKRGRPRKTSEVFAAYTDEDRELDRMLEELNQNTPDIETAPAVEVKKKKEAVLFLEELEDVKPCDSLGELERQRNLALMTDAEAIRATDKVMKYFLRNAFDKTKVEPGYMIYKNIRVYFEEIKEDKSDYQDIESKLFKK